MGAACEKEFQNVQSYPSDYDIERERIQTSSIKLQHKFFRPNSNQVTIGMIETLINSQLAASKIHAGHQSYDQSKISNPIKSRMTATIIDQKMENNEWGATQIDLEELHGTKRPFEGGEKIIIGASERLIPRKEEKTRELLDFSFFHSLGLPEYHYQPIPAQLAKEFENLPVCEQEDRSGVKYIGEWSKDLKAAHGNGVMQSNTTKYIGQFKNGLKHFHGRQIEKDEIYQGQFENGRRKGKGFRFTPGSFEEGQFVQSLVKGRIRYDDQSTYDGELRNNKYHGNGVFVHHKSGITQKGQFVNGKLHGKGQISKEGVIIYNGCFEENLKNGKGTYYWGPDHYFEGEYSKDKKHCKEGILRQGNLEYHGSFQNGQMDGLIRVFEILSNNHRSEKKPIRFQNGVRSYLEADEKQSKPFNADDEPSIFSLDGMPQQWKQAVKNKYSN